MDEQVNMESEINHESFSDYLKKRYPTRSLGFNTHQEKGMLHELIVALHNKFNTIGEIDRALARTEKAVELYERNHPPSKLKDSSHCPTGIVRLSMLLLYDDFDTYNDGELREKLAEYREYILPEEN